METGYPFGYCTAIRGFKANIVSCLQDIKKARDYRKRVWTRVRDEPWADNDNVLDYIFEHLESVTVFKDLTIKVWDHHHDVRLNLLINLIYNMSIFVGPWGWGWCPGPRRAWRRRC